MNTQKLLKRSQYNYIFCFILSLALHSCKDKTEEHASANQATVSVSLLGVENAVIDEANTNNNQLRNKQSITRTQIPSTSQIAVDEYHLLEVAMDSSTASPGVGNQSLQASTTRMATRTVNSPLNTGTMYKLLVYDEQNNYVTERDYKYGSENQAAALLLDAGKTYTFIAYSINSTNLLPALNQKNSLLLANVSNVSQDLMYFKLQVKLVFGANNLGIVLQHKYAQVTTKIKMDANMTGRISNVGNTAINPTNRSGNMRLQDGTLTYNGIQTTGATVTFSLPANGAREVTSQPTLLINPTNNNGILTFSSITIDDETKNNVSVPDVRILPGHRYNLNLTFKTCTEDVTGVQGMNWSYPTAGNGGITKDGVIIPRGEILSHTVTAPSADYGFVFDITRLDNSFNMELNGVTLATEEIQFERGASSPQNIRFADGSMYQGVNTEGGANVGFIYTMQGTVQTPIIKVLISRTGEVQMFGSKRSNGPLYPLELFNGTSFNKFQWNTSGTNIVKITQRVDSRTFITGYGYGKRKIPCN